MNRTSCRFGSPVIPARPLPALVVSLSLLAGVASGLSSASAASWQSVARRKPAAQNSPKQPAASAPAMVELQKRMETAVAARELEPEAVARANGRLIALGLREMGQLQLLEGAFTQAIELYRRSLDFEEIPDTRVDLAIAYLFANKPDDSLAEAAKAIGSDPENARAWNIQGKAWMKKKDNRKAAESLARSIGIYPNIETAYSLGICLLASEEREKAAAIFREIVESAGDRGSLHVFFARAYDDAGFVDDAVRELKKAVALDPRTPHAHSSLGLIYLIQNAYVATPESRREFLKEVQFHPRDFPGNYFLGVMASLAKQFDESDRYLKLASEIDPSSSETWLYLGLNAYGRKDNGRAEELLRKAIALTANQDSKTHSLIRKGYVVLGRILVNSGRKEEGGRYLQKARELQDLTLSERQQDVGGIEAKAGPRMGGATVPLIPQKDEEISLPEAATGDPTAQIDASVLARANLTAKEKEQAIAQDKQLRAILGASFNDLATSEARRQQYALALGHYHEAERWDPEIPGLMRNIGTAAFRLGDYRETVRILSKALVANPADNQARAMLGMAYFATDAYVNAARTITPLGEAAMQDPGLGYAWAASLARVGELTEAARVLDGVERGQLSADTLILVGQLWTAIGEYSRAVDALHRALQIDPSLRKAHYYSGLAYIRAVRPADAAEEFRAELDLAPDDPDAKYNLGFAFLQQSRRDEAVTLFRSVISTHPEHANAQYQLGKILLDEGDVKEAIAHLEEAARLSPETDYIHYQLQAAYRKESRTADADRELQLYKELKARNRQLSLPRPEQKP